MRPSDSHQTGVAVEKKITRTAGAVVGGAAGLVVAGPAGAVAGAGAGAAVGDRLGDNPKPPQENAAEGAGSDG